MTLPELLALPIQGKNILVLGMAGAGKTHIANLLCYDESHQVIHTDETIDAGYSIPQAIWSIFEDVRDCHLRNRNEIVEGILGYSLLLEGFKHKAYFPDIIIDIKITRAKQRLLYLSDPVRNPNKLKYLDKFHKLNLAIFNEWFTLCPPQDRPQYLTVENNWSYATEQK